MCNDWVNVYTAEGKKTQSDQFTFNCTQCSIIMNTAKLLMDTLDKGCIANGHYSYNHAVPNMFIKQATLLNENF